MATQPAAAVAAWYPKLEGLKLPSALVHAVRQAYLLIYSLRDSLHQLSASFNALSASTAGTGTTQLAQATSQILLSSTLTDIPGCSLQLKKQGQYLITAVFTCFVSGAGDEDQSLQGQVFLGAGTVLPFLTVSGPRGMEGSVSNQWLYKASANAVVKIATVKPALATGISTTTGPNMISAVFVGG